MSELRAYVQAEKTSSFALKSKSFRFLLGGNLLARTGDWMDLVALNWAVWQYAGSPFYLGLMNACRLLPIFLLSVPAGVMADRYDRRKLLLGIQSGIALSSLFLAYCMAEQAALWLLAVVVAFRSCLTAMDTPVFNSLIPSLVPKNAMASALALHTMVLNLSRIVGPAIAGWLMAYTDAYVLIFINAICTIGLLFVLLAIKPKREQSLVRTKKRKGMKQAFIYIKTERSVQSLLILAIAPMVFGFPYTTMLPLFVDELMGVGAREFGLFLSVSSVGAIVGTLFLSVSGDMKYPGRWLVSSLFMFGFSFIGFMTSMQEMMWALLFMFLVGFSSQLYRTLSRITLQEQVPDELRGRILSVALMDRGFIPLGAMMLGVFAATAGAFWTGIVMGGGCIFITLIVLLMRRQIWNLQRKA